jgi:hypothetical protein
MSAPVSGDASRPTREFLSAVAEKLAARRREKGAERSAQPPPAEVPPALQSGYEYAAAVLAWFEPDKIRPLEDATKPELLDQLLAASVQTSDSEGQRRWTLQPGRRIAALRELREAGRIEAALAANTRPTDPVQDALDAYLIGKPKPVEGQTLEELAATYQICGWLRAAGFEGLPATPLIEQRIDWLRLLQPFEHLAGDDQFRGRTRELQQLRSYAGVLPPGSLLESARRALEHLRVFGKAAVAHHRAGRRGKINVAVAFHPRARPRARDRTLSVHLSRFRSPRGRRQRTAYPAGRSRPADRHRISAGARGL